MKKVYALRETVAEVTRRHIVEYFSEEAAQVTEHWEDTDLGIECHDYFVAFVPEKVAKAVEDFEMAAEAHFKTIKLSVTGREYKAIRCLNRPELCGVEVTLDLGTFMGWDPALVPELTYTTLRAAFTENYSFGIHGVDKTKLYTYEGQRRRLKK